MTDTLTYPGDCTNFDPEHIYGPDLFGGCYRAFDADYQPGTDQTTLHLVPIPHRVIQERGIIKSVEAQAQRDMFERIEHLFGTGGA
ncbi:hypothetical protein A9W98_17880 [Mycobacterium gordonae]|uniref:Uncharacterized protein n=1 Tax=Mycobacterium gordonae TaxID=1778 RepID=A0A1A6BHP8_MYCGO|nr:hypothetical protein [Mycobacterium gordonae]OBS01855.1 hypothetical protein A9W98_17880 [Mycobacterium gordonae]